MENSRKYKSITIQVIVAALFLVSAIAKMYPSPYFAITTFEMKQLLPLGFSEEVAVYFSRILIGAEFALGLLLLQRHYLRKVVVPATILMLVVFIIHLTIDTLTRGNSGSCGCFGELLPMTPVEAIIKNIVAVGLLVWLWKLLPKGSDKTNFWVLSTVTLAAILMVFMIAPIQPKVTEVEVVEPVIEATVETNDTITQPAETVTSTTSVPVEEKAAEAVKPVAVEAPAQTKSVYSKYFANTDKGKHIVALFVPGCEHCRDAAKELTQMKAKDKNFPDLSIIFMDEEADKIPEFFEYAGAKYPYKIIDIASFWKLLGNDKDTPGVLYLWNGNIIKDWNGINEKKFVGSELKKIVAKPYAEIKK